MTKERKIGYGVLIGIVTVLLVLGSLFDLQIAQTVYQPTNIMARLLESVGIFPPFVFVGATFAVLFYLVTDEDKKGTLKKVLCFAAVILTYLVFGYMASETYVNVLWGRAIFAVVASGALTPLTLLFFRNRKRTELKRFCIFLIFASIVSVVASLITINVVKFLWGRPRFREMVADGDIYFSAFTPWYKPNGFTLHGHHSFPSGHTCAAATLLSLCALEEVFPEAENRKQTIAFIIGLYIFSMAYSRLVLGAHFLSDVAVGFLIGFVTYAVARYFYFEKSRTVLNEIMELNQTEYGAKMKTEEEAPQTPEVEEDASVTHALSQDDAGEEMQAKQEDDLPTEPLAEKVEEGAVEPSEDPTPQEAENGEATSENGELPANE